MTLDNSALGAIGALRSDVAGPVYLPGDPGYDGERAGYNLALPKEPALIVGATNAADVAAAVRFAAEHDLPISVQATGHGGTGLGAGALMISTRRMSGVSVDPETRLARVEAGVRWQQVIEAAAKHGLAPLNGSSPTVGVVSYTLGGGMGPLARPYGWAADRVRALELVTADGQLRRVTADEHPDLFWAVRGGKGNFGVVTALEFELVQVSTIYGGGMFFPGDAAAELLRTWLRWTTTVPDEMTSSVALLRLPPWPEVPEPLRGQLAVHVRIAYAGPTERGAELVAPLRAVAPPLLDAVAEMPFAENPAIHMDPVDPLPAYERTMMLRSLNDAAIDALLALAGPGTDCALMMVELRHLGGALARPADPPNAVGHRDAAFNFFTVSAGGPDEAGSIVAAEEALLAALEPWGTGTRLLNFMTDVAAELFPDAWDPDDYARLAAIKAEYDPRNRFRININVQPTATPVG